MTKLKGSWEADFDTAEFNASKEAKVFPNFMYESACIDTFSELTQTVKKVVSDVDNITQQYSKLKTLFEEFTNFNGLMDQNSNSLTEAVANIQKAYNQVIEDAIAALQEQVKSDESFQSDIDQLTSLLNNGSISENIATGAEFKH